MTDRALRAVEAVLAHEGGYVDHKSDRGGPTNFGVTIDTLSDWRGYPVSAADVRGMRRDEAVSIYLDRYVSGTGLEQIDDDQLFAYMVDATVHHGLPRAVKLLQKAIGTKEDGILGRVTLGTVNRLVSPQVMTALRRERALFMGRIVQRDPTQAVFLPGWLDRALA